MASNLNKVNLYLILRNLFNFSYENPDLIKPSHIAIYLFAVDRNNRMGWKEKFGLPTDDAMEATGIKSKTTYYKAVRGLEDMELIKIFELSKNQNTANIISIPAVSKFKLANDTAVKSALDIANIQRKEGTGNIDIQVNHTSKSQGERNIPLAVDIIKIGNPLGFKKFEEENKETVQDWNDLLKSFNNKMALESVQGKIKMIPSELLLRMQVYLGHWQKNNNPSSLKSSKPNLDNPTDNIPTE